MPKRVSIVVFRECDPSIIYGVFDTLWAAGRFLKNSAGQPLFEPSIIAAEHGPLELITGVSIIPQASIEDIEQTDIVFVPNVIVFTPEELHALDRRLIAWVAKMHRQGAVICSACGGSLVLAAAGLLSGRETTTHWSHVPVFRREFPDVKLHEDRILVQTGEGHSIISCGGASSWQDLSLLLIARYGSGEEAIRISRLFLYQWHRDGQLPYASMAVNVVHGDAVILKCQTWLAGNYDRADIIPEVTRLSGLPKRTFDRRFKAVTGYSPLAYVQALRIEEAKQMLETGSAPVDAIGREVGYEDASSFSRLFRRLTGISPGDYRRRFRIPEYARPRSLDTRPSGAMKGSAKV
ncbi:GlxA family transcriptional regulator [Chelativorans salis]|uniref:Helix-turn-helix domain-containing protein n=1 Tax=Chelativorans salis TaxID=2978478 RepID=A0ABT2LXS4_9HYPH|nr:helix-turn-helix domain-containing protein [Chelativorans sp. EGI FJ00035]MCT7378657.1 helix-turn-helix domain-containing protein [Chelativorans sp. EGI FJ00035]